MYLQALLPTAKSKSQAYSFTIAWANFQHFAENLLSPKIPVWYYKCINFRVLPSKCILFNLSVLEWNKPGLVRCIDHCVMKESLLKCLVGTVALGPDTDYVGGPIAQSKLRVKLKFWKQKSHIIETYLMTSQTSSADWRIHHNRFLKYLEEATWHFDWKGGRVLALKSWINRVKNSISSSKWIYKNIDPLPDVGY